MGGFQFSTVVQRDYGKDLPAMSDPKSGRRQFLPFVRDADRVGSADLFAAAMAATAAVSLAATAFESAMAAANSVWRAARNSNAAAVSAAAEQSAGYRDLSGDRRSRLLQRFYDGSRIDSRVAGDAGDQGRPRARKRPGDGADRLLGRDDNVGSLDRRFLFRAGHRDSIGDTEGNLTWFFKSTASAFT